jgi:hypothetical protein
MANKKETIIFIVGAILITTLIAVIFLRPWEPPIRIIAKPYTIEPFVHFGTEIEDPGLFNRHSGKERENHVIIRGVFKGGPEFGGEDVTHKIDFDELVALLANTRARGRGVTGTERWSIYVWQNEEMHVMLWRDPIVMIDESITNFFRIDATKIAATLERMVTEYDAKNPN